MAEQLTGVIEKITFHNQENGYCILRVATRDGRSGFATVIGNAQQVVAGEHVTATGQWVDNHTYGRQFKADRLQVAPPATAEGIEKYLCSGPIRGIGPTIAARIVAAFGDDTLEVIDKNPDALATVPGIGPKLLKTIREDWQQHQAVRNVMVFLHSYGVGTARAIRIYKTYGDNTVAKIRENPYCLCDDIWGVGFGTADELALKLGVPQNSPFRAQAAVRHILSEAAGNGHTCYPHESLVADAANLTDLPTTDIEAAADHLISKRNLEQDPETGHVYLGYLFAAEVGVTQAIRAMASGPHPLANRPPDSAIAWAEDQMGITLTDDQRAAIKLALTHKVVVITGGPGTGKTTITRAVVDVFAKRKLKVLLCAPTGRAAKRLGESTGHEAKTIHRLLEFSPEKNGFQRNRHNPLDTDMLVIDETSMVDVVLMYQLLQAVPPWSCVLFVGDADQLPSVGAGLVLADLIASGAVAVARLTRIHRQAVASKIIVAAHAINHGEVPNLKTEPGSDLRFVEANDSATTLKLVLDLATKDIPQEFGFDPFKDIQVLTPQLKTDLGVANLNRELQAILNPAKPNQSEVKQFDTALRVGDKIIQTINDYDKMVFNGDGGFVTRIDPDDKLLVADFDGKSIRYGFDEMDQLRLAYASTVHKAQGGEYPAVVVVVHTQHWIMLQRNLFYTAITRGKKLVVLVGSRRALARAATNAEAADRHTLLRRRLAVG